MWEVAGLKFHTAQSVLIRRNTFRDLHRAAGVWLDYLNGNCRVTGNLFQDITSCNGTLFVEVSHVPNVLDHNIFWNIRPSAGKDPADPKDGSAVCTDSSNDTVVAHNFFGNVRGFAACVNNLQAGRMIADGRMGECRGNQVLNNVFFACPRRIYLGRMEGNSCDGNLFDAGDKDGLFDVQAPAPNPKPRLGAWQAACGQDRRSLAAPMEASLGAVTAGSVFPAERSPRICVLVAGWENHRPLRAPDRSMASNGSRFAKGNRFSPVRTGG